MKKWRINDVLKTLFAVLAVASFAVAICSVVFCVINLSIWLILTSALCFVLSVCLYWLAVLKHRGFQLKYYFSNKRYNEEIEKSLIKFKGAHQTFIDEFKHRTKIRYRYAGYLFSRDLNDQIYKDKKSKEIIFSIYEKLHNSILSKGGFIEFFKELESLNFESNWLVYNYMINDLISNELEYLITAVFNLTEFTVYDNELSKEFTERNNQTIEDINEIYSPILFNFKNEIEDVLKKLKN